MAEPVGPREAIDRRDAVMRAALSLFAERGFHGTRVPDIADRAGVATGTIYRYFRTKEALVNAVFQERKRAFAAATALVPLPGRTPAEQARAMWRRVVDAARADIVAFRFLELHHHADYLDAESRALSDRAGDGPLALVEAARAAGLPRTALPAAALLGLVSGALAAFVRDAEAGAFPCTAETIDAAGDAVWRMLAG